MPSPQGHLELLQHPAAQAMLHSTIPARLAYVWTDGTPRVVPIWFHWTGTEIVMGSPAGAPKLKALHTGAKVAITIDEETLGKQLMIRGTATVTIVPGLVPEYILAGERYIGKEGMQGWMNQLAGMNIPSMARIAVKPEWVGVLDFRERFPSAIELAMGR